LKKRNHDWLSRVELTHLERIPEPAKRGPRYSPCQEILKTVLQSPTGIVQLTWPGDAGDEDLLKSYRSLMQYRTRIANKYPDFRVRKDGNRIFVSVEPATEPETRLRR
jgi:hypothetical protein